MNAAESERSEFLPGDSGGSKGMSSPVKIGPKTRLLTKVFLITSLIILLIQGLNCALEIGFLFRNLEQNSTNRYLIIAKEMKRKLETSLLFGKPLSQLNFERLLEGLLPKDVENLYIVDADGKTLYAVKSVESKQPRVSDTVSVEKTRRFYHITIPLEKSNKVIGNMVSVVPISRIRGQLIRLIKDSAINSLVIIILLMPLFYLVLSFLIKRYYASPINDLSRFLVERDQNGLMAWGIDSGHLLEAERHIQRISSGEWLSPDNKRVYEKLKRFSQTANAFLAEKRSGKDPEASTRSAEASGKLESALKEIDTLISEQEALESLAVSWKSMQSEDADI